MRFLPSSKSWPVFVAELVVWWGVCTGVWLLTLSSVDLPDLVVASFFALPCALAARAVRVALGADWRARVEWLGWTWRIPPAVLLDTGRVLGVAAARPFGKAMVGELREIPLRSEPAAVAAMRRGLGGLVLSTAPGTVLVDSDPDRGTVLVHVLASGWPSLEEVIAR